MTYLLKPNSSSPQEIISIATDPPGQLVKRKSRWRWEIGIPLICKQNSSPFLLPFSLLPDNENIDDKDDIQGDDKEDDNDDADDEKK